MKQRKKVLWSDESRFTLYCSDGGVCVWCLLPECIESTVKFTGGFRRILPLSYAVGTFFLDPCSQFLVDSTPRRNAPLWITMRFQRCGSFTGWTHGTFRMIMLPVMLWGPLLVGMVTMGSSNWTGLCRAYQAPLWQVGMLTEAMPPSHNLTLVMELIWLLLAEWKKMPLAIIQRLVDRVTAVTAVFVIMFWGSTNYWW